MDNIIEGLIARRFHVRRAAQTGDDAKCLRRMVKEVYVQESGYHLNGATDPFDGISQYYLATVDGVPAGCARMVDPLAFPEAARGLPHTGERCRLPMEGDFQLDDYMSPQERIFEVGRFVLLRAFRGLGGLAVLMGAGYLHARGCDRTGAVCLSIPETAPIYAKMGWQPLGETFMSATYRTRAQAMMIRTKEVTPLWQELFLRMAAQGVITI